jgi:microcystin-dependent protein
MQFRAAFWAFCRGQILAIQQNSALFAILGTTYGGNGTTNFALPNMQGQGPMHWGTTGGLPTTVIGEMQGMSNMTLLITELPPHNHGLTALGVGATSVRSATPDATKYLANATATELVYDSTAPVMNAPFSPMAISVTGGGLPHENMQPYLALNYCIAVQGAFPSRN